jgi:hypothetical protein
MQRKTEEIRNELTDQIDKIQEIKDLQTELGPLQTAWQSYLSKLDVGGCSSKLGRIL